MRIKEKTGTLPKPHRATRTTSTKRLYDSTTRKAKLKYKRSKKSSMLTYPYHQPTPGDLAPSGPNREHRGNLSGRTCRIAVSAVLLGYFAGYEPGFLYVSLTER